MYSYEMTYKTHHPVGKSKEYNSMYVLSHSVVSNSLGAHGL